MTIDNDDLLYNHLYWLTQRSVSVLIVNGKHKADIFKTFLNEPISEELPETILRLHPNFIVIADEDAVNLLSEENLKGPA